MDRIAAFAGRAALVSATTQGIAVVTGLQEKFSWRSVAASAAGAGMGAAVGGALRDGGAFSGLGGGFATDVARGTVAGFAAGLTTAALRGGKVSVARVATDAFGNALGDSIASANGQSSNARPFGETEVEVWGRVPPGAGYNSPGSEGGITNWRNNMTAAERGWEANLLTPPDAPEFPEFEAGDLVAGPGGAPHLLIKKGASAAWQDRQQSVYKALENINAALSMGAQDRVRISELGRDGLVLLNDERLRIQGDAKVMAEIAARDLTDKRDIETMAMLGVLSDEATVHRIAVAASQAGGAGLATGQDIAHQLNSYKDFDDSFMSRISGDASIERGAPSAYLNTLLNGRRHVDTTMSYLATMSDRQFDQLSSYVGTVADAGGLMNFKQNEALAGAWSGLQGSPAAMGRIGEGLSIAGLGLRNVGRGLMESIAGIDPAMFGNSTLGKLLYPPAVRPLYAVPPNPGGYSVVAEVKLNPIDFGRSRTVHFNRANAAFDAELQADATRAAQLESYMPGVGQAVSANGGRKTPEGYVWEHASTSTAFGQSGVMRLVPKVQHTPGSDWWRVIHPDAGAAGGYSEWAIPAGAPKNRK